MLTIIDKSVNHALRRGYVITIKGKKKGYPIYALRQFRPYIYGKHTKVVTDHKPLLALLKNKELTGILQRYQMAIMEYDITIVYLKGEDNHVADYLSRTEFNAVLLKEGLFEDVFPIMENPMNTPYVISKFHNFLNEKEKDVIKDGDINVFYRGKRRVFVPKVLREELLRRFHSHPLIGQHFGFDKLADKFCLIL
uniref:RT_RNaseH domain-containing protein n=1 Tax=Strongyloides papillosus TaxID=174720 RepID=A0A0N5B4A6_STREA